MINRKNNKAFILIFTLWVLSFLTVLAVGLAAGIRQKIVLLEKLDQRTRMFHLLDSACRYTVVYVADQLNKAGGSYSTTIKINLHNNTTLGNYVLADDHADISYSLSDQEDIPGIIDEERKININVISNEILTRLIERILNVKFDAAKELANNIIDWRMYGESQLTGFFSDEYYRNLTYPYHKKDANYENLQELLLVKGVTKEIYEKLINYVTIYGEGKVNINTASAEVLYALGLDDSLVDKIIEARQGKDGLDNTLDDHVYLKPYDISIETNGIVKLLPAEIKAIDGLNQKNLLTTFSNYFTVSIKGQLARSSFIKTIHAVISSRESKILAWQER